MEILLQQKPISCLYQVLGLTFVIYSSGCGCKPDDTCITFNDRVEDLEEMPAEACGEAGLLGDSVSVLACLVEHLESCKPSRGYFVAIPPNNAKDPVLYAVFTTASCEAHVLITPDPDAPEAMFTEILCKSLEATSNDAIVVASDCKDKEIFPIC